MNREYKFSFQGKNNYEFKIPYDGHLIKNIYLKADMDINENKNEINEWRDLKIFDNPHFLNYKINNLEEIEDINLDPIYKNIRLLVYNDYFNEYELDEWKRNILNYFL